MWCTYSILDCQIFDFCPIKIKIIHVHGTCDSTKLKRVFTEIFAKVLPKVLKSIAGNIL